MKFSKPKPIAEVSPRVAGEFVDTPVDKAFKAEVMAKPVRDTPPEPTRVTLKMYNELSEKVVQLTARVKELEHSQQVWEDSPPVVDDTHPAPRTQNGHPVTSSGIVAPFIEVPSLEAIMGAAKKYKAAHGDGPFAAAVKSFGVNKLSELSDEQRALFLERITDNV